MGLLPATLFGALTVSDRGTGQSTTTEASTSLTGRTAAIAAGSTGVLCIAADNAAGASANLPASITDSVGNVWRRITTQNGGSTANTTVEVAIYVAQAMTTQLQTTDTVTITYTSANVPSKAWTFTEVAPAAGKVALVASSRSQVALASTTISLINQNTFNLSVGMAIVAMVGAEGSDTFTGDADTTNGTWSTQQHNGAGSGLTGMAIASQNKVQTTAASGQSYDPTYTSADAAASGVVLAEVDSAVKGMGAQLAATTTYVISPSITITAGNTGMLCIALDNAGASGTTAAAPSGSFTDSVSNTWTRQVDNIQSGGGLNAGSEIAVYTSPIATNFTPTDTMTLTWAAGVSVSAKAWVMYQFTGSYASQGFNFGTNSSTTTPSADTTGITLANGDTVIGAMGAESLDTFVADADTTNGSWSQMASVSAGAATVSAQAVASQYKVVNATGLQTYNPTLGAAVDVTGAIGVLRSVTASKSNFLRFFPKP